MATYKIALKLYQEAAGDENALVRISVNDRVVAENVEITPTSAETAQLVELEVDGLPDPGDDVSACVKVELLNDLFIDSDNDRNVRWIGCGYACQHSDGKYYRRYRYKQIVDGDAPGAVEIARDAADYESVTDPRTGEVSTATTWFVEESADIHWQTTALEYTGDDNGVVDTNRGWWHYNASISYVEVNLPLRERWL